MFFFMLINKFLVKIYFIWEYNLFRSFFLFILYMNQPLVNVLSQFSSGYLKRYFTTSSVTKILTVMGLSLGSGGIGTPDPEGIFYQNQDLNEFYS